MLDLELDQTDTSDLNPNIQYFLCWRLLVRRLTIVLFVRVKNHTQQMLMTVSDQKQDISIYSYKLLGNDKYQRKIKTST